MRYVGVTHYLERAQDELADMVQAEKPDFLQINYSVVTRGAEKRVCRWRKRSRRGGADQSRLRRRQACSPQ